jgi:peptidoglycan/LPS O-acetylase OafA/YrhL
MSKSNVALNNLRAVVIVIVLAFHSALAYLASVPAQTSRFGEAPFTWQAFPVVDPKRWMGFDVFCAWQDVSLMSLMFFLSGLLASGSLRRKGSWTYVSDRLWRIGVPFVAAIIFLSPLAFYPAYLARTAQPSLFGFWQQWFSLPFWPSGPEWFLWQLLVANVLAALLFAVAPRSLDYFSRLAAWAGEHPVKFFGLLIGASALAYVPLALFFTPWSWSAFGPFSMQLSRPAHYLVYFFAGFALGTYALDRGLLASNGPLARYWLAWWGAAVAGFGLWAGLTALTRPEWSEANPLIQLAASLAFPIGCAGGVVFLVAVCLRFSGVRHWMLDSLSANAYSMYLIHYVFVVWLQYTLVDTGLYTIVKYAIVLTGALVMSWASSVAFERVFGAQLVAVRRAVSTVPH